MTTVELLRSPDEATEAQRQVYNLVCAGVTNLEELRMRLGLKSILPVRSRLQHLADKGIIAIT